LEEPGFAPFLSTPSEYANEQWRVENSALAERETFLNKTQGKSPSFLKYCTSLDRLWFVLNFSFS
jgi:hypothetical protein